MRQGQKRPYSVTPAGRLRPAHNVTIELAEVSGDNKI